MFWADEGMGNAKTENVAQPSASKNLFICHHSLSVFWNRQKNEHNSAGKVPKRAINDSPVMVIKPYHVVFRSGRTWQNRNAASALRR